MPRIVRILVYEGPQEWLNATLENKNRYVQGDRIFSYNHSPWEHRSIREALLPSPSSDFASLNSRALAIFDEVRGERSAEVVQAVEDQIAEEDLANPQEEGSVWV